MLMMLFLGSMMQSPAAVLPAGSYRLTCEELAVGPQRLLATCQAIDGSWHRSTLAGWARCDGAIANIDGQLVCERRTRPYIPLGSYRLTCTDVTMQGPSLRAVCETRTGQLRSSMLPRARSCSGEIANIDGVLQCT